MKTSLSLVVLFALLFIGCSEHDRSESTIDIAKSSDNLASEQELTNRLYAEPLGWPMLYGPYRTGQADATIRSPRFDADGPRVIWEVELGTGYGSPVVQGDRVVVNHRLDDEDIVLCLDASTGKRLWEYRSPNVFECKVEYSNGPYSTPTLYENQVFTVGGQGQLACLELSTGECIWKRELHAEFDVKPEIFPVGSSPLVVGDSLFFNVGASAQGAGMVAFDRMTGETLWTATDHKAAYCTPIHAIMHGQSFLFAMTSVGLVSLDPKTGKVDWEIEHHSRMPMSFNAVSPIVLNDRVLAVTGPGPGCICVQVNADRTFTPVWEDRKVLDSQFNGLMLADGNVFGFTSTKQYGAELRCVDFATGELKWEFASSLKRGQGLIAGDALVLVGEHGHLGLVKQTANQAESIVITEKPFLKEPCYCSPAISEHGLFLKDEHRICLVECFDPH